MELGSRIDRGAIRQRILPKPPIGPYVVESLEEPRKITPLSRLLSLIAHILLFLLDSVLLLSLTVYLWLLASTMWREQRTTNKFLPWQWTFLAAKLFQYCKGSFNGCPLLTPIDFTLTWTEKLPKFSNYIIGSVVPRVDIIITAYGEDTDVVLDTVKAACVINYPVHRYRVIVSDDGASDKLRDAIRHLAIERINLYYYARDKKTLKHHGFKSGNLNCAMKFAADLFGGPSPWVAILDADMIPSPRFLRILVGNAVNDDSVAMVALPQNFYNIPQNDPLNQSMRQHSEDDEASRAKMGAAWCPGSGFLINRFKCTAVNGFPEDSIAEDVLMSWYLQARGDKIIYVNEREQCGLQPNNFTGHSKQREKWTTGHSSYLHKMRKKLVMNKMTSSQRGAALVCCIKPYITTIPKVLEWILVALCLLGGRKLVPSLSPVNLIWILRAFAVYWTLNRVHEVVSSIPYGYFLHRRKYESNIWQSPYFSKAIIQEYLPLWLGGRKLGFDSTGSVKTVVNERQAHSRSRPIDRVMTLHQLHGILYLAFFPVFIMALVLWRSFTATIQPTLAAQAGPTSSTKLYTLLSSALYPGLGLEQLSAFLLPLLYIINPPTDRPRREMMEKDSRTGVWYPAEESKVLKWTWRALLEMEIPQSLVTIWVLYACFAL